MGLFAYAAIDRQARAAEGTVTADTIALARQLLRAQGLCVARIEPVRSKSGRLRIALPVRRQALLAEFWRSVSVLLSSGTPLAEALEVAAVQQPRQVRTVIGQVYEQVCSGKSLAEALAAQPEWFDAVTRALVEVGQRSGALADCLEELAEFQERQQVTRQRLGTALIYPAILVCVGSAVVLFLMTYVVPQLVSVLAAAGRELPGPTRWLKAFSDGLIGNAVPLALGVVALGLGWVWLQRSGWGRRRCERLLLAVPILGDLMRKARVAHLCTLLTTLLRSDVRFVEALRIVRGGLREGLFTDELDRVASRIEAGARLADPLKNSRLMPPLVVHVLALGQESGELPVLLDRLRRTYEKEVQIAQARFLAVLEPGLILVLAVIIGFVVYATLLPILETTRIVQ